MKRTERGAWNDVGSRYVVRLSPVAASSAISLTEVTLRELNRLNTSILNCRPSTNDGAHATFMSTLVVHGRRPAVPRGTGELLQRMNDEPYGCGSKPGPGA